ncbi:MAG: hypothetical protein EHM64_03280 [Ignavibacteriae bacterium]|nr:MAG: hypothetical protein EHM64_03280 [Ignavibacteriota bacterium]
MKKKHGVRVLCVLCIGTVCLFAQVKPKVNIVGGDNVPAIKQNISGILETVLLEMNRLNKGKGDLNSLRNKFSPEAFDVFTKFIEQNKPYTARKIYEPQMVERQKGEFFDIRSLTVNVELGETEASQAQNLIITFSKAGLITSVRSMLPNYDYEKMISEGNSAIDSLTRGLILDFLEQFRMGYNNKDLDMLQKVYSDEALIIVGTVLKEKGQSDDFSKMTLLTPSKVKLVQQSKSEYLEGLRKNAFRKNSFLNVRFEDVQVMQHEKVAEIYGITCRQLWNSSNYSDTGHLFLMMDFRNAKEPIIHVRSWQPKAFEDGTFVGLYDFDVVSYGQ